MVPAIIQSRKLQNKVILMITRVHCQTMTLQATCHQQCHRTMLQHQLRLQLQHQLQNRIDKLQDQKIENGSSDEDYDDDSREIMKLQSELIRKNNLIDALLKVLISLK